MFIAEDRDEAVVRDMLGGVIAAAASHAVSPPPSDPSHAVIAVVLVPSTAPFDKRRVRSRDARGRGDGRADAEPR